MPTITVDLNLEGLTFQNYLDLAAQAFERENPNTKLLIAFTHIPDALASDPVACEFLPAIIAQDISRVARKAAEEKFGS